MFHAVVCLSCAAHKNEGKERLPAGTSVSVLALGWEAAASLHQTVWIFTDVELKAVKLRAQPESVICVCDNNV